MDGDACRESEGPTALEELPEILALPNAAVWVDLVSPTPAQVQQVATALDLHPLIVEDVLEGNQRAKIEATEGVVHIVLFDLDFDDKVTRHRDRYRPRPGFPAHRPRRSLGSARHAPPARRGRSDPQKGPDHLLWAIADDIVDGYFPFADRMGDAIDDVQDRVVRKATPGRPRAGLRAQAGADRGPSRGRARSARSSTSSPTATEALIDRR